MCVIIIESSTKKLTDKNAEHSLNSLIDKHSIVNISVEEILAGKGQHLYLDYVRRDIV